MPDINIKKQAQVSVGEVAALLLWLHYCLDVIYEGSVYGRVCLSMYDIILVCVNTDLVAC